MFYWSSDGIKEGSYIITVSISNHTTSEEIGDLEKRASCEITVTFEYYTLTGERGSCYTI